MSWTTSVTDLRNLLSDGPTDRYRYRKTVLGDIDGVNATFKTFEFRRVNDFTSPTSPIGVFVNNALATVSADDLATGEFTLDTPPAVNARVRATYYAQWFLDSELEIFLTQGTEFLGLGSDVTQVDPALQPAVTKYAAADGYQKLALKWAEHMSEAYRMEDAPADQFEKVVQGYMAMASSFRKEAITLRNDFYTREGQTLAPRFQAVLGAVRDPVPRR